MLVTKSEQWQVIHRDEDQGSIGIETDARHQNALISSGFGRVRNS